MVFPSCTHREPSASFAASGVKTQSLVEKVGAELMATKNRARNAPKPGSLVANLGRKRAPEGF